MSHQFPSERHRRLDTFVGTWDTTIVMTSADGNAARYRATDSYHWSANEFCLMHDVTATMGDDPITSLEIIAADPLGPHYVTRSYDADGTINDFTARLDGEQWFIKGRPNVLQALLHQTIRASPGTGSSSPKRAGHRSCRSRCTAAVEMQTNKSPLTRA